MTTPLDFDEFFERATGNPPYEYQRQLAQQAPSVLHVPTGSGKTQGLIASWLFSRINEERAPRRLVYALPMRALVEQTYEVALEIRRRLDLDEVAVPIHVLMGGEAPTDWRMHPERNQILIGTIDMLLSRALNRGYAESRFVWPVSFGLLHADCRWVLDEVQLMGPARSTSAQLDGLHASLGTALPCEMTWVSATVDQDALLTIDRPELGSVMSLPERDRAGPLAKRLNASKTLERADLAGSRDSAWVKEAASNSLDRHVPGTRTLVALNTVERAQAVFKQLRKLAKDDDAPRLVLLHSRYRRPERKERMGAALAETEGAGTIVVATQVIEAGVDTSARTLVTETAPFSSIVQRLGRCNREAEHDEATVLWLDGGSVADDATGQKAAAPYAPIDVENTRLALRKLEGSSLSPAALEEIHVDEVPDDPAILRRRDLLDLFDTSPDLSGMDIDIAPFIREDDDRSVSVFFREVGSDAGFQQITDQPLPSPEELVQVPRASLGKRACWIPDHVNGGWWRAQGREVPPGGTAMLSAAEGGYDPELGWDPDLSASVEPIPSADTPDSEGLGDDPGSAVSDPQELLPHLQDVADEVAELAGSLNLDLWTEPLRAAGALHDLGKAHPVFQATLRRVMDLDGSSGDDGRLWAKSGRRGGRHERRYFRHELASALAMLSIDATLDLPDGDLAAYLVGAHHGKVRLSIRPAPGEERPDGVPEEARFALGVADGDVLPNVNTPLGQMPSVTLDLSPMELGAQRSWTDAAVRLRDDPGLGPFRLGFLEALLRVADWKASHG